MTIYRCLDCRDPRWSTTDPREARAHAARFDCLIHPDPGRAPPSQTQSEPDRDHSQLTLDI